MKTIAVVVGSVMMFGVLLFIIPDRFRQIEIIKKGSKVPVIIESIPKKSWGKYKYYTFKYEGGDCKMNCVKLNS